MPNTNPVLPPEKQARRNSINMLVMLTAPAVIAWYRYGSRALLLLAVCMASSAILDSAGAFIIKNKTKSLYDFNSLFTGAAIALMLPASFPLSLAVAGCAFAIIVAKLPFGAAANAPFLPAAAGFAFMSVCWPADVFSFPGLVGQFNPLSFATAPAVPGTSLAAMLEAGNSIRITTNEGINAVNVFNILIGNMPGPIGTGAIVVLAAAAVYYLFTRPSALLNSLGFLLSCGAIALMFPRVNNGHISSLLLELCSGSLVFAALYLLPDPATSPKKPLSCLLYGAFAGILCMALRHFGVFEEGVCFAILLANAAWPFTGIRLDKLNLALIKKGQKKPQAGIRFKPGGEPDA